MSWLKNSKYGMIPEAWLMILRKHFDDFSELIPSEQFHLADLIMRDGRSRYKHHYFDNGFSICYQDIYKRFGRIRFHQINERLGIFDFTNWDSTNHFTRCFRLTKKTILAKEDFYEFLRNADCIGHFIYQNGRIVRRLRNAIASKDSDGNTAKNKNHAGVISPLVKVKSKILMKILACVENMADENTTR